MASPLILLVTCADLPDGDEDDGLLIDALRDAGADLRWAIWDDDAVQWPAADLVLIRSPWDYTFRSDRFVEWSQSVPNLVNPAPLIRWSTDKRYLADLAAAGVPIVPTEFAEPGQQLVLPTAGEFVVKPSVGAGSRGAGRFDASARDASGQRGAALEHARVLHAAGRTVMVQPYMNDVDEAGETGMLFFNGEFSHAIRKAPMLAPGMSHGLGRNSSQGLFEPERITSRTPSGAELELGRAVLEATAARFQAAGIGMPAYARVDVLPSATGPVLIELELVEPSLFLAHAPPANVRRFAEQVVDLATSR